MNKFEVNVRDGNKERMGRGSGFPYGYSQEFAVSYKPIAGMFNIYLFGEIECAEQFISAIEVLQAASENDVVYIHLSTNGGSLDATDTFLAAMRDCDARVVVKATGGVHSAGSVILLNADEFMLSENFNCLIHNGSTGVGGKFSDFIAQTKHVSTYMESVMRNTYAGFLSDAEIEALLEGKDFWMNADEFGKRFEARNTYMAEQVKKVTDAFAALSEEKPTKKPRKRKKVTTETVE
jgi:ATP-dependent protease ClpP protease subunit